MVDQAITCAIEDRTAILTLNRPEKRNALTLSMRAALVERLLRSDADDSVCSIILRAAGDRAFCAGADLDELRSRTWESEMAEAAKLRRLLPRTIEELGKPVIAALHGYVLGAGLEIAIACTIRIAAEDAIFGVPELQHGVIPGSGGTQRLPRLIGLTWSMDMILTGRLIDAQTALRIGLVSRVVPKDQLIGEAKAVASRIGGFNSFPLKAAKAAALRSFRRELDADVEEERRLFALCLAAKARTA